MINRRTLIFANGELPDVSIARKMIHEDDVLIAADAGADHILAMDLVPSIVIGDFDSISSDDLLRLESSGAELIRFPADKDKTDLELAIDIAVERGSTEILVIAALGGRLDMTLSNISLLTRPDLMEIDIRLDDGIQEVMFIESDVLIHGYPGDQVSLIPWGVITHGVVTQGLRWNLTNESLEPSTTRSISNEMVSANAEVSIQNGLLLCLHRRIAGS